MDFGPLLFEVIVRGAATFLSWMVLTPVILIGALFTRGEPYWVTVTHQYRNIADFWSRA